MNSSDGGANALKHIYALDDNSVVIISDAKLRTLPWRQVWIFVVDSSGAKTWYALPYFQAVYGYINSIVVLGPGRFSITLSDAGGQASQTFFVTVANHKLNNASPLLILPGNSQITNPCYAANPKIYYDAIKGYLGAGFYNAGGGFGGPVYSSNYKVNSDGSLTLLARGYVGNFTTGGYDPWDQTGTVPGGAAYKVGQLGNGQSVSVIANPTRLGYNAYSVNPGGTSDCVTPSGAGVGIYSSAVQGFDYGGEPFFIDSTIAGIRGLAIVNGNPNNFYGAQLLLDNGLKFQFQASTTVAGASPQTYVITRNFIFCNADYNGYFNAVLRAPIPPGWNLYTAYSLARKSFALVNSARPISIFGRYKA